MTISSSFRSLAVAVIAAGAVSAASAAHADSGTIRFAVYKAAFFVGGSGGEGTLTFHGKRYPISIGGISGGLAFGASKTLSVSPPVRVQATDGSVTVSVDGEDHGPLGATGSPGSGTFVVR